LRDFGTAFHILPCCYETTFPIMLSYMYVEGGDIWDQRMALTRKLSLLWRRKSALKLIGFGHFTCEVEIVRILSINPCMYLAANRLGFFGTSRKVDEL
jgi:hypothetical protein